MKISEVTTNKYQDQDLKRIVLELRKQTTGLTQGFLERLAWTEDLDSESWELLQTNVINAATRSFEASVASAN
jgi:hypothetical protein